MHTDQVPHRPNVHFHCEIDFDPFSFMEREKKIYGGFIASKPPSSLPSHHILVQCYVFRPIMLAWPVSTVDRENKLSRSANSFFVVYFLGFTITLYEFEATIKTLWKAVKGMLVLLILPPSIFPAVSSPLPRSKPIYMS